MSNGPELYSDPDILPSLSPISRKQIGNSSIAYNTSRANVVDFGLTRMLSKDGVVLVHMGVFEEGLGLLAVNQGKAGIDSLPNRIRSRPIPPKGEGWKKQQDTEKSHHPMVIHYRRSYQQELERRGSRGMRANPPDVETLRNVVQKGLISVILTTEQDTTH
jgi:hypothetical protein